MTTTNTPLDSSIPPTDHSPNTGYPPPPAPPTGDGYPPPPMPAPRRRKGGTAAMIVGAVLVGSGFLTAVSGGALLGLFGAGQQLSSGEYPVSTSSSALVADLGQIDRDVDRAAALGDGDVEHLGASQAADRSA